MWCLKIFVKRKTFRFQGDGGVGVGWGLTLCCGSFSFTSCWRPWENDPPLLTRTAPVTVLDRSGLHLFWVLLMARMGDRQRVGGLKAGFRGPLNGLHEGELSVCGVFRLRLWNSDWSFISISKGGLPGEAWVDWMQALGCWNVTYTLSWKKKKKNRRRETVLNLRHGRDMIWVSFCLLYWRWRLISQHWQRIASWPISRVTKKKNLYKVL